MKSRVQIAIGLAVAVALIVVAIVIWTDRMQPVSITFETPVSGSIHVSVTGAVTTPGVVEVPSGARLQHVVDAAGGFTDDADTDHLNLAGRVGDGETVAIPVIGAAEPAEDIAVFSGDLIDLNTASAVELDELPGIGEVLAGRIVSYREENGPFTSVDQLTGVEGISQRTVEEIRPLVTIGTDD